MFPNDSKVCVCLFNCYTTADLLDNETGEDVLRYNATLAKSRIVDNTSDLATVVGVLIAVLVYIAINVEELRIETLQKFTKHKITQRALVLALLILTSPIIFSFTLISLFYKVTCYYIIKANDVNFASFLDGFDVFWSLEDDDSRCVINVLGIVETNTSDSLVSRIKQKLRIVITNKSCNKLFYRRNEKYGWYYWRNYSEIDLNDYVKVLNIGNKKGSISKEDIEGAMTEVSYLPLPFNDTGLFQIFVTEQRIENCEGERSNYGIIFRIHHAVGDGVALIEFLCKTLADDVKNDQKFSMPSNYIPIDTSTTLLDKVKQLCSMPICFVDGILRKPDQHSLHGPSLIGKKIFKWTDPDVDLYQMIKDIKQCKKNLNFSDILATSLSSGLRNFFSKTMDHIPEDVAVILPIRLPEHLTRNENIFKNNFTVTILDLPTKEKRQIKEIRRRCNIVRKSVDPTVNHYFLKVCYLLPKQILRPIFKSSQATLVFSNMPGPDSISICGGNSLKSLIFFIPNKGSTGLGISALCYGGVLRFSAMADASIVRTSDQLSLILDGMVDEIKQMHELYVK
ncbi:uncharacterized protein LOC106719155 [Papilio machaon]|uniref:uncharacterized protein LOC106719155 n=1 Tax=Papilio machaon TaxID=76193 RepID=UPI001E664461|nr:uncharacterized protein LOC106719155 [Papilio machaon]